VVALISDCMVLMKMLQNVSLVISLEFQMPARSLY